MIEIVETLDPATMMVKPAVHLPRFFHPGKLNPLKVRIALIQHGAQRGAKVFVGPANVFDNFPAFR